MVKDKELKEKLLEKLMQEMDGRVVERDLKPKSKMVVEAEGEPGDSPEDMKEGIIDKLQGLELPSEDEMGEMHEGMEGEEEELEEQMEEGEEYAEAIEEEEDLGDLDNLEEDEDYLNDMPHGMKQKLLKELRRSKKQS